MSTDLQLISDSAAFVYSWSGSTLATTPPWNLSSAMSWYRGKAWYSSATSPGILNFGFDGTSAAIFGSINAVSPQAAVVRIDNGNAFVFDYGEPPTSPALTYRQWFVTPTLPGGSHTITITNLLGAAVDYAVVKAGNQASLTGQTVIVDDDSPLIQYQGQWSRNTDRFTANATARNPVLIGYPNGNSTHRSSNPGDSFAFRFSGTAFSLYGIFSFSTLGSLTANYSVDGTIYTVSDTVNSTTPAYVNGDGEFRNYLHFGQADLPAGIHTIMMNITGVDNKAFALDYITYLTLLRPVLAVDRYPKSIPTGAIVGGVLGGVVFGAFVMFMAIRWRKATREPNYADHDANIG